MAWRRKISFVPAEKQAKDLEITKKFLFLCITLFEDRIWIQ